METNNVPILIPVNLDEFWNKLRDLVKAELKLLLESNKQSGITDVSGLTYKPLLKAHEICSLLKISRQTLNQWQKDGILTPYKIKSRVYFLWSDIEKLISPRDKK